MRIRRKLIKRACPLKSRALSRAARPSRTQSRAWRRSRRLARHWRESRAGSQSWQQSRSWCDVLRRVVQEYIYRRHRHYEPVGRYDNAGRWYPTEGEALDCCRHIRSPSRAYPYSLLAHCRTAKHVAALFDVPPKLVLRRARLMDCLATGFKP